VSNYAFAPIAPQQISFEITSSSSSQNSITPANPNQAPAANISTVNATSNIDSNNSSNSEETLTEDTANLLKHLAQGNVSAAKTDLTKLTNDLANQAASTTSSKISHDYNVLQRDLTNNGNANVYFTNTVNNDLDNLQSDLDLQTQSIANVKSASTQNYSTLDTILSKITDQLDSGSVQGALEDFAGYMVQNGHVSGSLLNVTA
jgi:hypothetical protein